MANPKTKVVINSVTVHDDDSTEKYIIRYEITEDVENEIGEAIITTTQKIDDAVDLRTGLSLEIWRGYTTSTDVKIFSGYISQVKPKGGIIEVVARNKLWDLIRKNVNKVYDSATDSTAGVISAIAEDLIETYGELNASVIATGTGDGEKINQFKCINTDIWERLQALKKAVDYQIRYVASTDIVHFEPRGYTDSGLTITVGEEIINVPDWDEDTSKLINNLRLDGATSLTDLRFPLSGAGQIGTTTNFEEEAITLPKTPEIVKLTIDSSNPPTTIREGGSADGSTGNYYYVDKENRQIKPIEGTTFNTGDYAIAEYTWAAPAPVRIRNETSISQYGEFEKQITLSDISSISDAETRAREIIARFSTPLLSAEINIRNTSDLDIGVGQIVTVIDNISRPNRNRQLVVFKRKIKYPGNIEELTVGDAQLRLEDWQMQTEERIKRLEEELLRNQDLIVELINIENNDNTINNARKQYPRYKRLYTQDYTTADNTLIWDNPTKGIWDTDNWATDANPDGFDDEVLYFVQSFNRGTQNKYVETFYDNDFEDTSTTTADWGSNELVFDAGETARSTSIDYNNGTIVMCTLAVTGSGAGTPVYYLSANGGTNWETATNNAIHTFTNTGTDLRFRVDVAGGTYTITQIILSAYH